MTRLKINTQNLLNKSKESCLLAVEIYNKPLVSFKSGGFIVLMIIAWTSLIHAIFERDDVNYYYKEKNNYFYKKDKHGNKLAWSLSDSIDYYFKKINTENDETHIAIKENLNFFIDFRNEIEHHFMPELDEIIFGKCQALLNNFEYIFTREFGEESLIDENLSFSLQFSNLKNRKFIPTKEFKKIKKQISKYDKNLPDNILSNENYSFNIYLIQVSNKNNAEYSVNFIHENDLDKDAINKIESATVITRNKKINVSNSGYLKPTDMCKLIQQELSKLYEAPVKFGTNNLNKCCEDFEIKFIDKDGDRRTNKDYCIYDDVYGYYSYSPTLVKFIAKKFKDKNKFIEMFPNQKKTLLNLLSPKEASKKIEENLNEHYNKSISFGVNYHSRCCKHYKVKFKTSKGVKCDEKFCLSCGNDTYGFTEEWVEFLSDELKDREKFNELFPNQKI